MMVRRRHPTTSQLTPEDYLAYDSRFQGQVIGKSHAEATIRRIARVERYWESFSKFMGSSSVAYLIQESPENYRCFLNWRLDNSSVAKKSTIWVDWKYLRLLFRQKTGRRLDDVVGKQITDHIDGPLKDEYDLDLSIRSKPVMGVDDLLIVLHHLWTRGAPKFPHERQRVQTSLLIIMTAYNASRPGALIESGCLRGTNQALCYKDVQVLIIKNPAEPSRNLVVMEVTFLFMKGQRGKSRPTTFLFHERDDNLVLCPVLQFLSPAFSDEAFDAAGIKTPEDVFRLNVPDEKGALQLKWKQSMLNTPIFRRSISTPYGIRTSPDKALPYDIFNKYLGNLGEAAGFPERLTPYCIRRGSANAVDGVATIAQRNQVMGHSRSDIFERYYQSRRCMDVQSAFLRCDSQDALVHAGGKMSLLRDPRAPTALSLDDSRAVNLHPKVVELHQLKSALSSAIRAEYGKIKNAEKTPMYQQYKAYKGS